MFPYKSVKAITEYSLYLKKDLMKYIQQQTGTVQQTKINENVAMGQVQEISSSDEQNKKKSRKKVSQMQQYAQDMGFQLQIDEPPAAPVNSLKTYQFWVGLFCPQKKSIKKQDISQMNTLLQLEQCIGYNSQQKSNCIILDQNCYCFSIGCNLVLCPLNQKQRLMAYKRFQKHLFQISYIHYNSKYKILISGSKGHKPQIIIWRYQQSNQFSNMNLKYRKRMKLPTNSQGVEMIRQINESQIICVDWISIHRSSSIFWFSINDQSQYLQQKCYKMKQKLQKILDVVVNQDQNSIFVFTNKGLYKYHNLKNKIRIDKIQTNKTNFKPISSALCKNKLFIGDVKGNILVITQMGSVLYQQNIHQGLIFIVHIIPEKELLLTSGAIDSCIKIHSIHQEKDQISLKLIKLIQLRSYCTSLSSINEQNILIGCRDGIIILYDIKANIKRYQKQNIISCQERKNNRLIQYNKINQRLVFTSQQNKLLLIKPIRRLQSLKTQKIQVIIQKSLKKFVNCVALHNQKILQVFPIAQKKYRAQIITSVETKQKNLQFSIQFDLKKQGKPKIAKFNQQFIALGTKSGYVVICHIKTKIAIKSQKHHDKQIQDLIFSEISTEKDRNFFIKTISKSQLFYWQIDIKQQNYKIKKIEKAEPIKNLTWCSISKYCWETRKIWQKMTHYEDIQSVALINQIVLCIAMYDGTLRIYKNFLMDQKNMQFVQFKLFSGKFNVLASGKQSNLLVCEKNYQFFLFKVKLQKK